MRKREVAQLERSHLDFAHYYLPVLRGDSDSPWVFPEYKPFVPVKIRLENREMLDEDCFRIAEALKEAFLNRSSPGRYIPLLTELSLGENPALSNTGLHAILQTLLQFPVSYSMLFEINLACFPVPLDETSVGLLRQIAVNSPNLFRLALPSGTSPALEGTALSNIYEIVELNSFPISVKKATLAAARQQIGVSRIDLNAGVVGQPPPPLELDGEIVPQISPPFLPPERAFNLSAVTFLSRALESNMTVVILDLNGNSLGDTSVAKLAQCLRTNSMLRELYLRSNGIAMSGGNAIVDALREGKNRTLTELDLTDNRICDVVAARILQLVEENTTALAYVRLERNCVTPVLIQRLLQALMLNTQPPRLKQIIPPLQSQDPNFTRVVLAAQSDDEKLDDISARVLLHSVRGNPHVRYIDLSNNSLTDEAALYIAQIIEDCQNLRRIILQSNYFTDFTAQKLLDSLSSNHAVETLDLKFQKNEEISPVLQKMIDCVAAAHHQPTEISDNANRIINNDEEVTEVHLEYHEDQRRCRTETLEVLASMLEFNHSVQGLYLSGHAGFFSDEWFRITFQIANRLVFLDLSDNGLRDSAVLQIIPEMLSQNRSLRTLLLERNQLTNAMVQAVIDVLRTSNDTLSKCSFLGNIGVTPQPTEDLEFYCNMNLYSKPFKVMLLSIMSNQCSTITEVNFSHIVKVAPSGTSHHFAKQFDDLSAQLLCRAMVENDIVNSVNFSGNRVTDIGAQYFARMLTTNPRITKLDLSYNELTDVGLQAVGRAINWHHAVRIFRYEGNTMKDPKTYNLIHSALTSSIIAAPPEGTSIYSSIVLRKQTTGMTDMEYAVKRAKLMEDAILEDAMADSWKVRKGAPASTRLD